MREDINREFTSAQNCAQMRCERMCTRAQTLIAALTRRMMSDRDARSVATSIRSFLTIMKIHEYQAKAILARHGVPVPRGEVAFNAAEAGEIARRLGGGMVVVKAQIHAGGRGKGGGVKLAKSPTRPSRSRGEMIGMTLVTHQTGPEGRVVGAC